MVVVTVLEMVEEEAGFEFLLGCGREEVAAPEMVNKKENPDRAKCHARAVLKCCTCEVPQVFERATLIAALVPTTLGCSV